MTRLLSPGATTALFVAAQLVLFAVRAHVDRRSATSVDAAATDPGGKPAKVERVIAEILPVSADNGASPVRTPASDAEFWSTLHRDGEVIFTPEEVDAVTTAARRFDVDEVDVIVVDFPQNSRKGP